LKSELKLNQNEQRDIQQNIINLVAGNQSNAEIESKLKQMLSKCLKLEAQNEQMNFENVQLTQKL